ncbi:MAG: hypothetical protein HPY54_14460 [Chthonomonadetes bacterium]|nr:hypothetical protein [Chthonomonadetes bacterium]
MNSAQPELVGKALSWLESLIEEISHDPSYAKSGEEALLRIKFEIERLAQPLKNAVLQALTLWLESTDEYRFHAALILIEQLQAVELAPQLRRILGEGNLKQRQLPEDWRESLRDTLDRLLG